MCFDRSVYRIDIVCCCVWVVCHFDRFSKTNRQFALILAAHPYAWYGFHTSCWLAEKEAVAVKVCVPLVNVRLLWRTAAPLDDTRLTFLCQTFVRTQSHKHTHSEYISTEYNNPSSHGLSSVCLPSCCDNIYLTLQKPNRCTAHTTTTTTLTGFCKLTKS